MSPAAHMRWYPFVRSTSIVLPPSIGSWMAKKEYCCVIQALSLEFSYLDGELKWDLHDGVNHAVMQLCHVGDCANVLRLQGACEEN